MILNLAEDPFPSVQGEGVMIGTPMTFIRLQGCNLDCEWCDTEYAKDKRFGTPMTVSEIIDEVESFGLQWVCITGGEPMLQDLSYRRV